MSQGKQINVTINRDRILDLFTSLDPKQEREIEIRAKRAMDNESRVDPRHIFTTPPKPKDSILAPQSIKSDKIRRAIDNWDDDVFIEDIYHQYMRHMQRGTMLVHITFRTYLERCLLHIAEVIEDLGRKFFHGALTKSEYHFNKDLARLTQATLKKAVERESRSTLIRGRAR